jgi:eukaryotic-like serine/threonine-protein kinase
MLKVAGREEKGWLNIKDIEKFPCEDLHTIDQLWVEYSNGSFGFSVQKRIYRSVGGTMEYNSEVWQKFGDRVGWRKKNAIE